MVHFEFAGYYFVMTIFSPKVLTNQFGNALLFTIFLFADPGLAIYIAQVRGERSSVTSTDPWLHKYFQCI